MTSRLQNEDAKAAAVMAARSANRLDDCIYARRARCAWMGNTGPNRDRPSSLASASLLPSLPRNLSVNLARHGVGAERAAEKQDVGLRSACNALEGGSEPERAGEQRSAGRTRSGLQSTTRANLWIA